MCPPSFPGKANEFSNCSHAGKDYKDLILIYDLKRRAVVIQTGILRALMRLCGETLLHLRFHSSAIKDLIKAHNPKYHSTNLKGHNTIEPQHHSTYLEVGRASTEF